MEYGPRVLGHRSILADPGHPEMRDRVNAMVKMRESFHPFAPAVSSEEVDRWLDAAPMIRLPYMTTIVDVREEFASQLPAVTHINRSARVQTVCAGDDPVFHALLQAVRRETGREMVLNTSFNVKGQPIVCILTGSTLERDKLKKKFGIRRIAYVVKPVTREMILNCFRCYDHLAPLAEQITVGNLGYEAPAITLGH
jgi:predicted NodU family carbamoyl transferase